MTHRLLVRVVRWARNGHSGAPDSGCLKSASTENIFRPNPYFYVICETYPRGTIIYLSSTNVPKLLPPPCPPIPRPAATIRKPQCTSLVASHQRPLALDTTWIAYSCSIDSVESQLGAGLKRGEGRWGQGPHRHLYLWFIKGTIGSKRVAAVA